MGSIFSSNAVHGEWKTGNQNLESRWMVRRCEKLWEAAFLTMETWLTMLRFGQFPWSAWGSIWKNPSDRCHNYPSNFKWQVAHSILVQDWKEFLSGLFPSFRSIHEIPWIFMVSASMPPDSRNIGATWASGGAQTRCDYLFCQCANLLLWGATCRM